MVDRFCFTTLLFSVPAASSPSLRIPYDLIYVCFHLHAQVALKTWCYYSTLTASFQMVFDWLKDAIGRYSVLAQFEVACTSIQPLDINESYPCGLKKSWSWKRTSVHKLHELRASQASPNQTNRSEEAVSVVYSSIEKLTKHHLQPQSKNHLDRHFVILLNSIYIIEINTRKFKQSWILRSTMILESSTL